MTSLQGDIERLSKGPRLKGKLGTAREREPIPGKVTPFTDDTFATPSTAPAADNGSELECNVNENDTDKQENDDITDPNDPNSFYKGGAGSGSDSQDETGMQDVDSTMNDETGNDTIPSDYSSDPLPSTKGFTNLTDAEGNCFNVRMDGTFPSPEGWENENTPPDPEQIDGCPETTGGYYVAPKYTITEGFYFKNLTEFAAFAVGFNPLQPGFTNYYANQAGFEWGSCSIISTPRRRSNLNGPIDGAFTWPVSRVSAEDMPEDYQDCWPSDDGCYTLAYIDGTFQTNDNDCNAPENWEPKSTVYSFEGSVPKYGVTGTANGGYMVYDTNSDGTPNGNGTAKVFDSQGRFTAAGNPTSQFMNQYLPK